MIMFATVITTKTLETTVTKAKEWYDAQTTTLPTTLKRLLMLPNTQTSAETTVVSDQISPRELTIAPRTSDRISTFKDSMTRASSLQLSHQEQFIIKAKAVTQDMVGMEVAAEAATEAAAAMEVAVDTEAAAAMEAAAADMEVVTATHADHTQ